MDPLEVALRALEHRNQSAAELRDRLARRGITASDLEEALETLERSGLVDDTRFAQSRAASLAARGYGNAFIDADLERRGIDAALREEAVKQLGPEAKRARDIVERRGRSPRTARYLSGRGFAADSLEALFAPDPSTEIG